MYETTTRRAEKAVSVGVVAVSTSVLEAVSVVWEPRRPAPLARLPRQLQRRTRSRRPLSAEIRISWRALIDYFVMCKMRGGRSHDLHSCVFDVYIWAKWCPGYAQISCV